VARAKAEMIGALSQAVMMGWTPPDGIDVPKWRCRAPPEGGPCREEPDVLIVPGARIYDLVLANSHTGPQHHRRIRGRTDGVFISTHVGVAA
jgi:hypothetical protein